MSDTEGRNLSTVEIVGLVEEDLFDAFVDTLHKYTTEKQVTIISVQSTIAMFLGVEIGDVATSEDEITTNTRGFGNFARDIALMAMQRAKARKETN